MIYEVANGDFEIFRRIRFEEHRVAPCPECALRSGCKRRVAGHGKYRDVRGRRMLPQATSQLKAVNTGNVQIDDDHVGHVFHEAFERLEPIVRLDDAEARLSEPFRVHQTALVVVFNEQNAWARNLSCRELPRPQYRTGLHQPAL